LPVRFEGQRYEVGPLDLDAIGAFEAWVESRAIDRASMTRGMVSEQAYAARLGQVARLIQAGHFACESEPFERAWASEAGQKYLLFLRLRRSHADMTEDLASRIWDGCGVEIRTVYLAASPPAQEDNGGDDDVPRLRRSGGIKLAMATLVGEPFCLTPEQAGRVTLRQWSELYNHPRDDEGRLELPPLVAGAEPLDEKKSFEEVCRKRGLPAHRISKLWADRMARRPKEQRQAMSLLHQW
jgi:hypothetical protein